MHVYMAPNIQRRVWSCLGERRFLFIFRSVSRSEEFAFAVRPLWVQVLTWPLTLSDLLKLLFPGFFFFLWKVPSFAILWRLRERMHTLIPPVLYEVDSSRPRCHSLYKKVVDFEAREVWPWISASWMMAYPLRSSVSASIKWGCWDFLVPGTQQTLVRLCPCCFLSKL